MRAGVVSTTGSVTFPPYITDVVVINSEKAINEFKVDKFALAGGVAANSMLREKLANMCDNNNVKFYKPEIILCTDNAAMIGCAAYYDYLNGTVADMDINAIANLSIMDI